MHEHDLDLIMSLAEESLGDADASTARAEIASCAQCTEDLSLQTSALAALSNAPRVYLTATESAGLREAVRGELRLPAAEAPPRRKRRFPLGALAGAAAVLLAVVIAGPGLDLLGTGDEADTSFEGALAPPATEAPPLVAPAPEPPLPEDVPAPAESGGDSLTAQSPPAARGEFGVLSLKSDLDLEALRSALVEAGGVDQEALAGSGWFLTEEALSPPVPAPEPGQPDATNDADPVQPAVEGPSSCDPESIQGTPEGVPATLVGSVDWQGTPALAYAFIPEIRDDTVVVVISLSSCEVLARAEG